MEANEQTVVSDKLIKPKPDAVMMNVGPSINELLEVGNITNTFNMTYPQNITKDSGA